MKFTCKVSDITNPFYKACKNNGQAMGMAIPFILESQGLFVVRYDDNGKVILTDHKGKTYKTHFNSKGSKYNVSPSYQKGFGRSFNSQGIAAHVCATDFHIFASQHTDEIVFNIVATHNVFADMDKSNGEYIVA